MRIILVGSLWLLSTVAAADTLRVGSHLLVSGDSAAQVREALGRPSRVTHHRDRDRAGSARHRRGAAAAKPASESWIYRRDGREITVTLVDGAVTTIQQRP
ncbi:MAG TPA: hypothetical protein VGU65_02600 [Frateuria sp.]|uniref:hypothetical protein n=1 Tax=Frateuria sp. TaxID=2211372 RepID=UPI002DF418A4|nr:hypothetical protein [Frateuria sp.]